MSKVVRITFGAFLCLVLLGPFIFTPDIELTVIWFHDWIMMKGCEESVSDQWGCWKGDGINDYYQFKIGIFWCLVIGIVFVTIGFAISKIPTIGKWLGVPIICYGIIMGAFSACWGYLSLLYYGTLQSEEQGIVWGGLILSSSAFLGTYLAGRRNTKGEEGMDSVYSKEIKSYWEKETKKKLEKEKRLDDFLEMIAEKYNELVVEVSNPKVLDALILVEKEAGIGWEEHFVAVLAECGILLPESSTEEFGSVDKGKEIFPKTVLYRRKSYSVEDGLKVLRSEHSGMLIPEEAIDRTQLKEFYSSQNSRILITNDGSVIYKQSNSGFEKRIINEILNTIHLDDAGYPTGVIGYMESPPTLVYRHRKGLPLKRLIGQLKPLGRAIIVVHLFDLISNLHSFGWVHRDISLSNIICNLKVSPEELNEPSSVNLELIDFECAQRINTAITVANKTPHFSHKSNGQIGLQVSVEQDWYSYGWACLLVSKNTLNIKSILSTISTSNKGISVGRHYANEKLKTVLKSHDMEEKFAFMAAIIKLSTSHPSTGELGLKTNELLDVLK